MWHRAETRSLGKGLVLPGVVMLKGQHGLAMAVLPAKCRVDINRNSARASDAEYMGGASWTARTVEGTPIAIYKLDERGLTVRGLLVRHLVMPGGVAGTREVVRFLAREVSPDTYVNLMD